MILLFAAIAAATLGLRASFLLSGGKARRFETLERYVPIAALTALVVPALLPKAGEPSYARLLAGLAGAAIAYKTKNVFATVVAGLVLLLLLK